jgi:hypothetical protein
MCFPGKLDTMDPELERPLLWVSAISRKQKRHKRNPKRREKKRGSMEGKAVSTLKSNKVECTSCSYDYPSFEHALPNERWWGLRKHTMSLLWADG